MKRIITLLALALTLTAAVSCNKKDAASDGTTVKMEPDAVKLEIITIMDKFHNAFQNKKTDEIKNLIDVNGLYCGTDPKEIFSQPSFINYLNLKLTNPAIGTIAYKVNLRDMHFDDDNNNAATIVEQFTPDVFTQNISWRMVSHIAKKNNKWTLDFISLTLVPDNDAIPAVNMAAAKRG